MALSQRACRQRRGRGRAGRYWQSTGQSVWQYYFLVTKVQAHQWPNFCESFSFLKPQVNFQTEAGLKLALGVHKTIPPKCGRQHARNTDPCHGPWIQEQKCLYQSVIKHNILVGLSCASWSAFKGKRHRKRSIKNSTYPSIPKMYVEFMCTRPRKPCPKIPQFNLTTSLSQRKINARSGEWTISAASQLLTQSTSLQDHIPSHPLAFPALQLLYFCIQLAIYWYIYPVWPTAGHNKE